MSAKKPKLKRNLTSGKMQMIAIGGAIGVGLFMGSGSTISWTGPSVLIDYAIAGAVLYLIMRALGEMLYVHPVTGSFADFASEYIHPVFGYLTAWSNIFEWVMIGMSEVIAIGAYCNYWWPSLPGWIPGLLAISLLCGINLVSVKSFGDFEYWFSFIKIITILLMIVAGFGIILFGFGNGMHPMGISNLWKHGFFAGGIRGFFYAFSIVLASYQGIEFIGITAGEAENPKKSIIEATQSTLWRILIFYIGSIFVILSIYPWNHLTSMGSPFVETFSKLGISFAAGLINFVVLTAALSGCNSGIYSTSRMAYTLAKQAKLPPAFRKINKRGVPYYAILAVSAGMGFGVLVNLILPIFVHNAKQIFVMVYSSSVLPGMIPWVVILISQIRFRQIEPKAQKNHPFKMPFSPHSNYIALIVLALTLVFMAMNPTTQISLIIGIIFEISLTCIYFEKYDRPF